MYDTIFAALDLCGVHNLATVRHEPPSTLSISTDTLVNTLRSAGGRFTPEQEGFFARGGIARELLATISMGEAPSRAR